MKHLSKSSLLFIFVFLFLFDLCFSIRFYIAPGKGKKCLREEIHKDVLVSGEYEMTDAPGQKASIKVSDTKNHVLYTKDEVTKGKFAFTTEEYDLFDICFETKMISENKTVPGKASKDKVIATIKDKGGKGSEREVFLHVKHGIEAKSYDGYAKAEKLKPMEVELKRLEDLSESIVNDFAYMRSREEEMRDTNESTHSRVLYFSVFSMACLLGLAAWQVLYLRRYFRSKKLIE